MNKKNVLVNLLLIMVFVSLILGAVFLSNKIKIEEEKIERENVVLKEIMYDSEVMQVGFTDADTIISNFVSAYNDKDGKQLAQMMNLVATYIYAECEYESEFDKKYEEKLSSDLKADELLIMQYALKQEESGIIEGVSDSGVQLTLIENSKIEDISKYLSKMTAKIRTVSETENVDQVDTLEFLLLHRDSAYYIIKFDSVASEPYIE